MRDKKLKYLVICESPNKTHHLQDYIKAGGYNVHVMASVGHIAEIRNGGSYYNTGIDPTDKFKMDLGISPDKKDVVNKLKTQVDWADHVVLATDGDNEGAQISWSLIKFLKLKKDTYTRMITHEITPKAVLKAFENPVPLDTENAMASQARMCLDKIMGYRLSGIVKTYVGARSAGRCQSIGLKLVADREREIQNFVPETYFDLYVNFKKNKTEFKAKFVGSNTLGNIDHLKTQAEVDSIKKLCIKDYIIQGVDQKTKEEATKPPFDTLTFQQEVASKLGLSVKDAMSCAQKLFESGKITYHRTIDTVISDEFVPTLESYIKSTYGADAWAKPKVGKKTSDDNSGHECLRVTDPAITPEAFEKVEPNNLLQKVYRIVWQRTIAACLPNAVFSETGYLIDNNGQKFLLTSKELVSEGFKTVYSYKDDEDEDSEIVKETFVKGEVLKDTKLTDEKKQTRSPARYTEATLVKKLTAIGVGRPSTTATIVETVLSPSRGYATKEGKSIVPTEKGMQLAAFLDRAFSNIIKLDYTKEMEEDLDKVAEGKLTKVKFLESFYNTMEDTIKANPELKATTTIEETCPECGKPLVIRRSKFGRSFIGCSGFPNCKFIKNLQ